MEPYDLTFQEKKAAEAAFQGRPVQPDWSEKARAVYEGIMKARGDSAWPPQQPVDPEAHSPAASLAETSEEVGPGRLSAMSSESSAPTGADVEKPASKPAAAEPGMPLGAPGQPGLLVDLTPLAREVGLECPVVMSKPLWDFAITASRSVPAAQYPERLGTILKSLQHCLILSPVPPEVIMFHVPLPFPSEPVAKPCAICAVVHKPASGQSLTLLRPEEPWTAISRPTL